jgi:hypothetical protein
MKKFILLMIVIFAVVVQADRYRVKYRGITLGEIDDLSTLDELYLKAKVTNRVARFMLGEDNLVYYGKDKPDIKNAKFKKDKKMILYAFAESLKEKPKFKRYKINDIKNITLECNSDGCKFFYYKNGEVNGKGDIKFDKEGKFLSITEKLSHFEISKK